MAAGGPEEQGDDILRQWGGAVKGKDKFPDLGEFIPKPEAPQQPATPARKIGAEEGTDSTPKE